MKLKNKEMFKTIAKVISIYFAVHIFKVCFARDDIFNEDFLINTLGLSVAITIYYIFLDPQLDRF